MAAIVTAVSRSKGHIFSKSNELTIRLVTGLGVEGDAHMGEKVKHRYHILKKGPDTPNLRQVHLIHEELFDELRAAGFNVQPGDIGENVTTPLGSANRNATATRKRGCDRNHRLAQSLPAD